MNMSSLGWTAYWSGQIQDPRFIARVCAVHADGPLLMSPTWTEPIPGFTPKELSRLTVGDWVVWAPIEADSGRVRVTDLLPRRTELKRKSAGRTSTAQVLAANIDLVFVAMALDGDFNTARLDRYITMVWDSGATPVVLLTKSDLAVDLDEKIALVQESVLGVQVLAVSTTTGDGLDGLGELLTPGTTAVLVGSSGVGKSTLTNYLLGEDYLATQAVRAHDQRGRHTTTHRELIPLPSGAVLIDTPGVRELSLTADAGGLSKTFEDIETLAADCAFRDCAHQDEPGCAVAAAIEGGTLKRKRLVSYHKLQKEAARQARREDDLGEWRHRREERRFHKTIRRSLEAKRRAGQR